MVLETCGNCGDSLDENDEPVSPNEPDLRPEYCRYQDEGCEYAASCLECPFPRCFYDEPGGRQRWLKKLRNKEITRLFHTGRTVKELGLMFGVSQRTIQRAIKNETDGKEDDLRSAKKDE